MEDVHAAVAMRCRRWSLRVDGVEASRRLRGAPSPRAHRSICRTIDQHDRAEAHTSLTARHARRYCLLLIRTFLTLEGIAAQVDPDFNIYEMALPFALRRSLAPSSKEGVETLTEIPVDRR